MRLYHLEEAAGKHAKLEEQVSYLYSVLTKERERKSEGLILCIQNQRLRVDLRERELQLEALEQYLEKQHGQDASTQTTLVIDTSPQSHSPATASYHTAFAASPEAFGLTSCYTRHSTPLHTNPPSNNHSKQHTDVDHVVNAFQSVTIVSPALPRHHQRRSSLSSTFSDLSAEDTPSDNSSHQGVHGWLNQLLTNEHHSRPS